MFETIMIEVEQDDDKEFISTIEKILIGLVQQNNPVEITIIKIKNWFDHKWLNYSGKGIVHFENTIHPEKVALTNFWRNKITVPPFTPNRVVREFYFQRKKTNNKLLDKPLHKWQRSTYNLNNRIITKAENGFFFWYSSNSLKNKRGSIMAYLVDKDDVNTWYISFEKKLSWIITKTKGIEREKIVDLISK